MPAPPAGAAREAEASPSPPVAPAEAHLALAKEARKRRDFDRAREEAEKARSLFEKDGNAEGTVRALNLLGTAESRQGRYREALDHLNAALALAGQKLPPNHPEVARSEFEIGVAYIAAMRTREAIEVLEKSLALRRAAGAEAAGDLVDTMLQLSTAYSDLGDDERALALADEAEGIERAKPSGGPWRLPQIAMARGGALWGQGRYDQAIAADERAVALLEADKDATPDVLAGAYASLANVYWSKSDYDQALALYEKALPLNLAWLGEAHSQVGDTYYNLAVLHVSKGEPEAAIASAEKALGVYIPAFGEQDADVVQTYNLMGSAYQKMGEPDRSVAVLEKALAIQLSLGLAGRNTSVVYTSLCEAYRAKREFARALRHCREALVLDTAMGGRRHPAVAADLVILGDLSLDRGDEDAALRLYVRALGGNDPRRAGADLDLAPPADTALFEEFQLRALRGAARARTHRAEKRRDPRELERAARVYERAAALIDRTRAGYRAEGSKLWLAANATETYDEAIRTELALHQESGDETHLEAAFRHAERGKAGALRDALNEASARSFAGIPQELLDRERQLRADLAAADHRLTEAQVEKGTDAARLQSLRDRQFALKREYDALRQRFEREYPAYYDLKYRFETAAPAEIRERLLDERTVLVEYFLGKEQVFVLTIAGKDLQVASVPRPASLEADIQELRRAIVERDQHVFAGAAHRLYRLLLAPVEERIAGRDLLVVPDGPLSLVPFEALLERETPPEAPPREIPYVLRDHTVSYAYSATVALQGLARRREVPRQDFLGFAPFVAPGSSIEALPPLPASRQEVVDGRSLFARRQGFFDDWLQPRSRVYLGREATESRLKSAGLERYRYVHLATHGVVDEEHPGLSRLLLAPEKDSAEDGVLHLGEIYNLSLNADLVVLSACDTGRGRIARGEGIIGLARGFLYAGASSLLVSLWPVSDAAASGLVVDFYKELLAGRPKAQALREAKLRTLGRNPEYAKPYYWSSLVLVGGR